MRRVLLLSLALFLFHKVAAQIGFSKPHDFGQSAIGWGSIVGSNDTITIYGTIRENDQPSFGLLFSQFDTSGNLLQYKVYNDPSGDNVVGVYQNSFIKLANNEGYAGIGGIFERIFGFLALYNNDGTLRKITEYPDNIFQDYYLEILEAPGGFFILGSKQKTNYHTDIFLMKTDKEGNKLWEKSYGHPTRENFYGSIFRVNDNEYVIGGLTTIVKPQPQPIKNTSNFYVIDSLGNLKSSWQSEPSLEDIGVGDGLYRTEQHGWAYATVEAQFYPDGFFERKWCFIERDSNYNLVNRKTYGSFHNLNWMQNFKKLHNGDYLMIGSRVVNIDPPAPYPLAHMGALLRISPAGDSIWSFVDTAFAAATNTLYDAIELPSGSIIACGYSRTDSPLKDWGWIVKVSKDGCLDTLNCMPVSTMASPFIEDNLVAFPNPSTGVIYLEIPETLHIKYEIFDMSGLLALRGEQAGGAFDLRRLNPGAYILKTFMKDRLVVNKIIKL